MLEGDGKLRDSRPDKAIVQLRNKLQKQHVRKIRKVVMAILSCLAALLTISVLIHPAITIDRQTFQESGGMLIEENADIVEDTDDVVIEDAEDPTEGQEISAGLFEEDAFDREENLIAASDPDEFADNIIIRDPSITLELLGGAEQQTAQEHSTEELPWVWHADTPDEGHAFSFQINYSFSTDTVTKTRWEAGQIEIRIPLSVLKNRDGDSSDYFLMSLPSADTPGLSDENEFVYSIDENNNEIVITNRVAVDPTQVGFIQFSYLTSEQTFAYADYEAGDNNHTVSAPIRAKLIIKPDPDANENLTVNNNQAVITDNRLELSSAEYQVSIDTGAEITSTNKRAPTKYTEWQRNWGTEPARTNGETYVYLLWSVESTIRATQPFDLCLTDTPELVTEGIRQYEVAAYRKSGQTAFTVAGSIPDEHDLTAPGGEVIRTDYVVTRHSITHLPANWSDYEVKNSVTVTVTPVDHADPVTSCSDTESFAEQKIHYGGRPGDINAGKQGMTTSYELSKLTDYPNTSVSGLRYKAYVEGNTWYYTYQNEQGTTDGREDGYSDANRSFYGKVPVTFTIQENSQPNLLAGTAERHNLRVWYKGTQDTVYHYSDWLSPGDYQIDRVDYSYIFRDAEYDVAEHNFKQTANLTLEQIHEIQETATDRIGDLVFTLEKNGVLLDGELHYSFSSQSYDAVGTDANAILACISNESSGSALVFAPDAHITGYTLSNTNAMYYTRLYSEPSFSLLWNTGNSSVLRPILLSLGEKPTLNLWNTAILKVTQDDDLQNYYTRQHYDTVLGDFKESRLTKGWIARQNDALRRMYTVTWNVKMEETYTVDDETRYISQEGGCFYDLLPQGTEYVPGSLKVYAGGVELKEGEFFTSLETNYQYKGRDLLSVNILAHTNKNYQITYDTQTTWNTILELRQGGASLALHNAVAYVKGVADHTTPISAFDGNLLRNNCAGVTGDDQYLVDKLMETGILGQTSPLDSYALMTTSDCEVTAVVAGTLGLNKLVKGENASGKFEKTDVTYSNGEYAYRLSFGPYAGTQAKNLVLFDFLEDWEGVDENNRPVSSKWHGTFKSVDAAIAESRGVAVGRYVSLLDRDKLKAMVNASGNYAFASYGEGDLASLTYQGERVWIDINDVSLNNTNPSEFTAIAVDLRKTTDGDDFILNGGETISVTIHMDAPPQMPEGVTEKEPLSYNEVYLQETLKNANDVTFGNSEVVRQGHTEIKYHLTSDLWLRKVGSDDTADDADKTGVGGTTFRLTGTSTYGTQVNLTGTTADEGWLAFNKLEMTPHDNDDGSASGYYHLWEEASSPDYLLDDTVYLIEIASDGTAAIVGTYDPDSGDHLSTELPQAVKSVYIDVSGRPRIVSGPGSSVVSGYQITNTPRVHGDLVFTKLGRKDRKNTSEPLGDATFRLTSNGTDGKTDYGNRVVMEAVSDAEGNVTFENIEKGTYILEEIAAPSGYLLLKKKFIVVCDALNNDPKTGRITITPISDSVSGVAESRFLESFAVSTGSGNMDRDYTIYNEPVHELKLYKVDAASGEGLAGAEFSLSGISEYGTTVDMKAVSQADGVALFTPLEPGTYYLQETKTADEDHVLDSTIYMVNVEYDGSIKLGDAENYKDVTESGSTVRKFYTADTFYEGNAGHKTGEIYYDGFSKRFSFPNERERKREITIHKEWYDGNEKVNTSDLPIPVISVSANVARVLQSPALIDPAKWQTYVRGPLAGSCTRFVQYDSANFTDGTVPTGNNDGWNLISVTGDSHYQGKFFVRTEGNTVYWWANTEEIYLQPQANNKGRDLFLQTNIEEVDLSAFTVTKETTSFYAGFFNCTKLTKVVMPKFAEGSQLNNLGELFHKCTNLREVQFSQIDTSNVTTMWKMFYGCYQLEKIAGLNQFDTSGCDSFYQMFCFCGGENANGITELDLSSFTLKNGASCYEMFWGMTCLKTIYVSNGWDQGKIKIENSGNNRMFKDCPELVGSHGTTTKNNTQIQYTYAHVDSSDSPGLLTFRDAPASGPSYEIAQSTQTVYNTSTLLYTTNSKMGTDAGTLDQWYKHDNGIWTYRLPVYGSEDDVLSYLVEEATEIDGISYLAPWEPYSVTPLRVTPGNTVTIQNKKTDTSSSYGSIIVRKEMVGGESLSDWMFTITATPTGQNGSGQTGTVTKSSPICQFNNLPMNSTWEISETAGSDYEFTISHPTVTISDNQPTVVVTVTNTLKTGSLVLGKKVTGNDADPNEVFIFTVTLTDSNGAPITGVFGGRQGTVVFNSEGKAAVTLKAGETREIEKLPAGTKYTIEEGQKTYYNNTQKEYQTTTEGEAVDFEGDTGWTDMNEVRSISAGQTDFVRFVNSTYGQEPRGGFTIVKAGGTNTDEKFRFRIEFEQLSPYKTYTYRLGSADNFTDKTFTATPEGTCTIDNCEIGFGETADFSTGVTGLAAGVKYTVTEYQSEYIATYTITHGDANAAPDEENSNTAVRTALTTGRNTVYEKDETEVTFTNREPSFSLRIGKQNAQEAYLPGAVLTLYRAELELPVDDDAEEQHLQAEILRSTSDPVVISTGSYAQSMNLTAGSYILRETAAPDGYRKADDIRIEVSKDGLVTAWSVTREETAEGTLLREIQKTRMSGYSWQIEIDMVDQTECSLQKRWTDMSGQDTLPWPTGESIRLTVYTGASGPETQVVMMEIPEPETGETWSFPMGVDGKIQVYCEDARETGTDYQFRIVGLPPLEEDRNYYFIEDSVEGYLTPVYTMPDALETLQYAVSGGTIVNRQQSAVELPATGGRGKGLYYILGAGMLLCSGVLLWRRRA